MDEDAGPYRTGKALSDIIPPDRRRQKTIAIVVASMVAGVCIWQLGAWMIERAADADGTRPGSTPGYLAGRIRPAVLHGPGGDVPMPPVVRSVLNVWLQGCSDCMPAFDAMRELDKAGGLGVRVPIINIAYGDADLAWARQYGVDHNLVFDPAGANVVKPLGIGTFTTLVVDGDGVILHRDRPDRPGYRDRIRAAVGAQNLVPDPDPPVDPEREPPPTTPVAFTSEGIESVVSAHRVVVREHCWNPLRDSAKPSLPAAASVTLQLTIGTDGHVMGSKWWPTEAGPNGSTPGGGGVTGPNDPQTILNASVGKCVEREGKMWLFPQPPTPTTVNIPFKFVRE